ncbi:MAG: HAD family hydrolase [Elusimicrobiota bacterium]|jgi:putative hydrolase of the HAD superfamily
MLKAVLFDYGGTLDSDGVPWLERFLPLYKEAGLETPEEELRRAFYDSDDHLPERFDLKGLDLEATVSRQVGWVVGRLAPGRSDIERSVVRGFVDSSRKAFRRNRPLLERLGRRYRLGIVSNFYGNLEGILRAEGLGDLFGVVSDSGVVGCIKPEGGIFLHATKALGVRPEEALMVGDSAKRDMRGAENAGLPHAWIAGDRPDRTPCCPEARVLNSVLDLEAWLLN